MDATTLLTQDHENVKSLFARYAELDADDSTRKQDLFDEIKTELEIHSQIEEEIFYPAVRAIRTKSAEEDVEEALEEHADVKELLGELSAASPSDDDFEDKMDDLKSSVLHHAKEEEKEMFSEAREHLAGRLEEIGRQLEERKEALKAAEAR
jgi:hemerythrin superfamily protein